MNHSLQQKAQNLKQTIAQLRAKRKEIPSWIETQTTQEKISQQIEKITNLSVYLPPPQYIPEIDSSGNPIDLAAKYGITQEICITIWELMAQTNDDEFEQSEFLEMLQNGKIVNLHMRNFIFFKILKICSTQWWNDIFIVNFKYKNSKPAKTTLILKFEFPLKSGNGLAIFSPRNQHQLWNVHIINALSVNKKTFLEKTLERFWF